MTKLVCYCLLLTMVCAAGSATAATIAPVLRGQLNMWNNGLGIDVPWGCAASKNWLYVTADPANGLPRPSCLVIDVSNPAAPYIYNSGLPLTQHGYGVYYSAGRLYNSLWTHGYAIVDLGANGGQLTKMSQMPVSSVVWGSKVIGNRAYLSTWDAAGNAELYILDVTDPYDPRVLGFCPVYEFSAIEVRGNFAYVGSRMNLMILDISDPAQITSVNGSGLFVGTDPAAYNYISTIIGKGNLLYLSMAGGNDEAMTFTVLDIANPRSPHIEGQRTYDIGFKHSIMSGNYIYCANNYGFSRINVADPTNIGLGILVGCWGGGGDIAMQGKYLYTVGGINVKPPGQDNHTEGVMNVYQVADSDPDNAAPVFTSGFSAGDACSDSQLQGDILPSAASPAWPLLEGLESYASVSNGILRINDTGTASGNKIKWTHKWEAVNTVGTTVLTRARCASHSGADFGNFSVSDGRYIATFSIRPDRLVAYCLTTQTYYMDGAAWHTYRVTTHGNTYRVYVDEDPTPVLMGAMANVGTTTIGEVILGAFSSAGTQDIFFDYFYTSKQGPFPPQTGTADTTPDVSVDVFDLIGEGSLSGVDVSTAQAWYSTDGGATWLPTPAALSGVDGDEKARITAASVPFNQFSTDRDKIKFSVTDMNGNVGTSPIFTVKTVPYIPPRGEAWDCKYEGDIRPTASRPHWDISDGSESYSHIDGASVFHCNDTSTVSGSKVMFGSEWYARNSTGSTVLVRARTESATGASTYIRNITMDDGVYRVAFAILTDRVAAKFASGATSDHEYLLNGTAFHTYRFTLRGGTYACYVDENPTPAFTGDAYATSGTNMVTFGANRSDATQSILYDYVYYKTTGATPPAQTQTLPLSAVKSVKDGDLVSVPSAIVSGAFSGFFYVESDDRECGVRVRKAAHGVSVGQRVSVIGTLSTNPDGERCIDASTVTPASSGSVTALALSNSDLGGGDLSYNPATGAGQLGVTDCIGLNNVGLLVTTWGKCSLNLANPDTGGDYDGRRYLFIDDGSGVRNWYRAANGSFVQVNGVKVDIADPSILPGMAFVTARGISSIEFVNGRYQSNILPRAAMSDISSF